MHLGNAWAALLGWLAVRARGGAMVLRVEDLDPDRCKPEYTDLLLTDLAWLGLDWDEGPDKGGPCGPYAQSQRSAIYQQALEQLSAQGLLYPCYCTRKELRQAASAPHTGESNLYPGFCRDLTAAEQRQRETERSPALRLRCPGGEVTALDLLHGQVCVDPALTAGDFALRRADGIFAYQLAVVVDDGEMAIDLVVRGDDLLESTPAQAALFNLLGYPVPDFLHVPLLVDESGVRLSKRHGSLELAALRESGARPEVIVGYLAWWAGLRETPAPVRPAELVAGFDPTRLPTREIAVPDDIAERLLGE